MAYGKKKNSVGLGFLYPGKVKYIFLNNNCF